MKKNLLFGIMLLATQTVVAQTAIISVENPTDVQRTEVVGVDARSVSEKLGLAQGEHFVIINGQGQQETYQLTHDGLLLFEATVQPGQTAEWAVRQGYPKMMKPSVHGRVYVLRKDDLGWENDRSFYRIYGPALQKSGERSFGTDIWTKSTPELVADQRYELDFMGNHLGDGYEARGQKALSDSIDLATSFHLDHGDGMDGYAVGPTLGCGAPALMDKEESITFPYCWTDCKILDNGPLRFTAALTYGETNGVTEHRLISLDKGSHFNRAEVWYDGITQPTNFVTGVVLHNDRDLVLGKDFVAYADPTEAPQKYRSQIYVGTLFPEGIDKIVKTADDTHAIGVRKNYRGERVVYYFGSGWSGFDIRTFAQWKLTCEEVLQALREPLKVMVR